MILTIQKPHSMPTRSSNPNPIIQIPTPSQNLTTSPTKSIQINPTKTCPSLPTFSKLVEASTNLPIKDLPITKNNSKFKKVWTSGLILPKSSIGTLSSNRKTPPKSKATPHGSPSKNKAGNSQNRVTISKSKPKENSNSQTLTLSTKLFPVLTKRWRLMWPPKTSLKKVILREA